MASERQIAANRLNARKSTGPLSRAGKRRASGNAYRHGLASSRKPDAATARKCDQLAREIAGDSQSEIILELAHSAAEAEFDLARGRLACRGLINRVFVDGTIDPIADQLEKDKAKCKRMRAELRHFKALLSGVAAPEIPVQDFIDSAQSMPALPSERTAEAIRRALPELVKLNRYQVRAASRRNRAIKEIIKNKSRWRADHVEPEE
jgi:hypothetical protein